jgi:Flp pilus assembly protein CpaB
MSVADQPEGTRLRTLEPQPAPRRKLSSRIGLLHLIAIASGLLAFLLVLSWMRGQEDLVEVAVAGDVIRSGNVVTSGMLEFVEVPAAASFGDRFVSPDDAASLRGSVATRSVAAGEPLLDTDLRTVATPAGLRAMSLPLDINRAVGGELAVGDRVDVIGVDDDGPRYIATEVEVLDVPGSRAGTFGATDGFAVTLAVDDQQALALAGALAEGELHVLRSTGAPEVTVERLGGTDAETDSDAELETDGG